MTIINFNRKVFPFTTELLAKYLFIHFLTVIVKYTSYSTGKRSSTISASWINITLPIIRDEILTFVERRYMICCVRLAEASVPTWLNSASAFGAAVIDVQDKQTDWL